MLDELSSDDCRVIYPLLSVYLDTDPHVLQRREEAIDTVYFPLDAVYSIIAEVNGGEAYEVDAVGTGGAINLEVLLLAEVAPRTVLCQLSGKVAAMSRPDFESAIKSSSDFYAACCKALRWQMFVSQQTVACNAAHRDSQRCARWVLMTADQVGRNRFQLRSEYLAMMLGLKDAEARGSMRLLEEVDAIHFDQNIVTIVSRERLREQCCECYDLQNVTSFVDMSFLSPYQSRLDH